MTHGASMLCLHGFTGRGSSWRNILDLLPEEPRLRAWCPDLFGHDPATEIDHEVDFSAEIERLAKGIEARGMRQVLLVGYSLGARVGLGLLRRHPERFRAAVLIGVHPGLASAEERRVRAASDERLARLLEKDGVETFVDIWQDLPLFASQKRLSQEVWAQQHSLRLRHRADSLAASLRILGLARMPPDLAELEAIEMPVRLMVGEEDEKFRSLATLMVEKLPRGTLQVVPRAGHNLMIEKPGVIAEAITSLLYPPASD